MISVAGNHMLKTILHHIRIFLFGTGEYEKEWQNRRVNGKESGDWGEKDQDWIRGYWTSGHHPHREHLVQRIVDLNPASVLEIGCNCGPNLRILAEKLPGTRFIGIDINADSVRKGNEWMEADGITNVRLEEGRADDLSRFRDDSFDVVFTDAVLIYIGPDKIRRVLQEFRRVAGKKILLCEWNAKESSGKVSGRNTGKFIFRRGLWAYDYPLLMADLDFGPGISITHIAPEDWDDEIWREYGTLIEFECNGSNPVKPD